MHKLASLGNYGTLPNVERDLFAFARQAGLSVNSWLHVYLVPVRICRDILVGEETVDWPVLLPHEWFGELWERSLQLWSKYVLGTNEHAAIGKFWETVANSPLAGAAPDGKPGLIKMLLYAFLFCLYSHLFITGCIHKYDCVNSVCDLIVHGQFVNIL